MSDTPSKLVPTNTAEPIDSKNVSAISHSQIKEASEHLAKINSFIFGPSFNGKTGYNPYQWAVDKNLMGLAADLENNPTASTIVKILSISANEEPKVINPKSPRIDVFFEEQRRAAAANKEAALNATKKNS